MVLISNQQLALYLVLFISAIVVKAMKKDRSELWYTSFFVSFELVMIFGSVVILLIEQRSLDISFLFVAYTVMVLAAIWIDKDTHLLPQKILGHSIMIIIVFGATIYSFTTLLQAYEEPTEEGLYRVSIPYADSTLLHHLNRERREYLNPISFVVELNASSADEAKKKAKLQINSPETSPRFFIPEKPQSEKYFVIPDDTKIVAELVQRKVNHK